MHSVHWAQTALDELTSMWLAASPSMREQITAAVPVIDHKLATDPIGESESRVGDDRILFVPPLAVNFECERHAREVSVLHIWSFKRRGTDE